MNYELVLLLTGVMLFAYWFNFILGGPLSDDPKKIDVRAILFSLPDWMAIRRLKRLNLYRELLHELMTELSMTGDITTRHKLKLDKKLDMYLAGREFFTWEKSILCPICFHWWLTILVSAVLLSFDLLNARADFFLGAFTYLVNHFLIRKIS